MWGGLLSARGVIGEEDVDVLAKVRRKLLLGKGKNLDPVFLRSIGRRFGGAPLGPFSSGCDGGAIGHVLSNGWLDLWCVCAAVSVINALGQAVSDVLAALGGSEDSLDSAMVEGGLCAPAMLQPKQLPV